MKDFIKNKLSSFDLIKDKSEIPKKLMEFDIPSLYKFMFGHRGVPFPSTEFGLNMMGSVVESLRGADILPLYNKVTGVKYFMPMILYPENSVNGYQMPNEPTFSLSTRKNISKTLVVGNNSKGTVKELINSDDWQINIRGVIINEHGDFPWSDIDSLTKLYDYDGTLRIRNRMINLLGIEKIIFESLEFVEMTGCQHAQGYIIKAVSDHDINLDLVEEQKKP